MVTSTKELKQRLGQFLADPQSEHSFRDWFALVLRDAHQSGSDVETLAHEIMWAYLDQKRGLCTPAELLETLNQLATPCDVLFDVKPSVTMAYTSMVQEEPELVLERL